MGRFLRLATAWVVGGLIYLIAVLLWSYDGFPSIIFQPLCAGLLSAGVVVIVLILGFLLRLPWSGRFRYSGWIGAGAVVVGSLAVMVFGSGVGLTSQYVDPETGQPFTALHWVAALGSYFLLLFTIVHWPTWPSVFVVKPIGAATRDF